MGEDLSKPHRSKTEIGHPAFVALVWVGLNINPAIWEAIAATKTGLLGDGSDEAVGIVGHDAGDAGFD